MALVCMHGRLPHDEVRQTRIEELIRGQCDRLTRYESTEGGWDYPLYNYHQQYGTAFALHSLEHCRKPVVSQSKPHSDTIGH